MINHQEFGSRPGLLVSVRNAAEAVAALEGGADVIDVKEPDRGSLGAADASTIAAVVRAVKGRAPVTAAAGELVDLLRSKIQQPIPSGVSLFKIGLAGCRDVPDWRSHWRNAITDLSPADVPREAVAVAYADWQAAGSPAPEDVLSAAVAMGCPALLVDTWDKRTGPLFDHWPADRLSDFLTVARSRDLMIVLAGSLQGESLAIAARLRPDLLAVRAAACDTDRCGSVSRDQVRNLQQIIRAATAKV